ncbi:MAG: nicotinamide-nucleotide amidohydrolase family protein [Chloroflexota bacterium]
MPKLEQEIARVVREYHRLTGKMLTIGTAESASGGRIADKITNTPGSSDYFKGSVVSYSNEVKMSLLGVKEATLTKYGSVSRQTAMEMADGGRKLLNVDICISDTGIAGPSGATKRKPVGLFYLGLSTEDARETAPHIFTLSREDNKRRAVEAAMQMLTDYLKKRLKASRTEVFKETHVVTSFLEHGGEVLILRRSKKVGSYQGKWAGVSGYLESNNDEAQARLEIEQETGLGCKAIRLLKKGAPIEVLDRDLGRRWVVHPFLFRVKAPEDIRMDWEHTETRWIKPSQLSKFPTVPGLKDALEAVL